MKGDESLLWDVSISAGITSLLRFLLHHEKNSHIHCVNFSLAVTQHDCFLKSSIGSLNFYSEAFFSYKLPLLQLKSLFIQLIFIKQCVSADVLRGFSGCIREQTEALPLQLPHRTFSFSMLDRTQPSACLKGPSDPWGAYYSLPVTWLQLH